MAQSCDKDPALSELAVVGETAVLQVYSFTVSRVDVQDKRAAVFDRHIVRHPGSVAILAIDGHGRVALVRPYRPAFDAVGWEVPAGKVDERDGKDPAEIAVRELSEEVGVEAQELKKLIVFRNSPGHSDQVTTVFRATGLTAITRRTDGPEEHNMPVIWVDPEEALQRLSEYGPPDAKSLISLLLIDRLR